MGLLVVGLLFLWLTVGRGFMAADDCLDAGGSWREGVCVGARSGE